MSENVQENKFNSRSKLKKTFFKDFVTLQRGFDLPKKDMVSGPYPVFGSTSIIGYHSEYKVLPPGVVTGRSGSLGEVQYIREKYWPHNTSLWVRDFKGNFPRYVYYFLKTLDLKNFNSGVGVPTLNRNDLDTLELAIHDYPTQRKIASILSAYDYLIENNTRRIKILEEMAQVIYKEWFINFHFPGHEKVKMVDSELGNIPEGWEVKELRDFGNIITGKTPSTKVKEYYGNYILFIKTPDMHSNIFITKTEQCLSELGEQSQKNKTLPENSLCVSCIGTAGVVSITSKPSQTNQQINSIILKDTETLEFLFFTLGSLREQINLYGSTGATMVNLNKEKFASLELVCPSMKLIKLYHTLTTPIFNHIKNLQSQIENLFRTRDLLLPKLISGEIDVEELDINTVETHRNASLR